MKYQATVLLSVVIEVEITRSEYHGLDRGDDGPEIAVIDRALAKFNRDDLEAEITDIARWSKD